MITQEQLMSYILTEYAQRGIWLKNVEILRETAREIEPLDTILATMLRRMALSIEQYQGRLTEYVEQQETFQAEDDALVAYVLARARASIQKS